MFSCASSIMSQVGQSLKLWYRQPAGDTWENALPVGNGRLGAMVYGNVGTETIQLNEHTVWSGGPSRNDNPLSLDSLAVIRQLIFAGRQKDAEQIANRVIISKTSSGQKFEPVGSLHLAFTQHDVYDDYRRELDLERAVATTTYSVRGIRYTRQVVASLPGRVVIMRITASKSGSISFNASLTTPQRKATISTVPLRGGSKDLAISGTTSDHETVKGMVKFKGLVRIMAEGGTRSDGDTSITISNANAVTIFISIATNFNNYQDVTGDENRGANEHLEKAAAIPFARMLTAHVAAYQRYFNRVTLDLGTTPAASLPTDERLKNFRTANDPAFVALYFQYGRYLLISSSQPGGQPANLQGIWNNKINPPWDSKYTINI
ncbi:MAG: glycoside hydrolase family 95 protein, partial [Sphingobacteriales bacterium]